MPGSMYDYRRARRAAKRVGLMASRSNWRLNSIDNRGGFRLIDPYRNLVIYADRFELSADDVVEICADLLQKKQQAEVSQ